MDSKYNNQKNPLCSFQKYFNSTKNFNKCFGIGANKTGTTSLNTICKGLYGMRSDQMLGEACIDEVLNGNYSTLKQHLNNHDFHQDLPASLNHYYIALDILFPNSKFILTLRDSNSWFKSFLDYYYESKIKPWIYPKLINNSFLISQKNEKWFRASWGQQLALLEHLKKCKFKTDEDLKYSILKIKSFRESCISAYENRITCIQTYFAEREKDLLQVQVSDPDLCKKINKFFGLPEDIITYKAPIKNSATRGSNNSLKYRLYY